MNLATDHNCIFCNCKIKLLDKDFYETDEKFNPESAMWDGGTVKKISMGYGSILDGNIYLIAICDKCIEKNINIKLIGSYM